MEFKRFMEDLQYLEKVLEEALDSGNFDELVKKTFESDDPGKYGAAFFYAQHIVYDDERKIKDVVPGREPAGKGVCAYAQVVDSFRGDKWGLLVKRKSGVGIRVENDRFIDFPGTGYQP